MPNVLVIGGGPAGSTTAALLARAGADVTLMERTVFPRYHIGESTTPSSRTILDYIGALEKVEKRGYTRKTGLLVRWGGEEDWTVDWKAQFGDTVHSWQVDRDDFDEVLLEHAADCGVRVISQARVKRVLFDGERAVGVEWFPPGEEQPQVHDADVIIDASGRAGILGAQHFGFRRPQEIFRNVAIWGYWEGGELLPNSPAGGINVISSDDGWYWVIPLRDDRFSVGFVSHQTTFLERRAAHDSEEQLLLALVEESPTIRDLLGKATFQGKTWVEQDFSYISDRFCGPGYFLVGDAACFVDPLLSTGIHLAMYSALLAAASILAVEDGQVSEEEALAFYETLYRNAYNRIVTLVSGFYQKHAGRDRYFALAETLTRDEGAKEKVAFGEITSGRTDMREAADSAGKGARPLRPVIEAAAADSSSPVQGLLAAAADARAAAEAGVPASRRRAAPTVIEGDDLHDYAQGMFLVLTPKLGIGRSAAAVS